MLKLLKHWYARFMQSRFRCGFDWAAGELLLGQHTPAELREWAEVGASFEPYPDPFGAGVRSAVSLWDSK